MYQSWPPRISLKVCKTKSMSEHAESRPKPEAVTGGPQGFRSFLTGQLRQPASQSVVRRILRTASQWLTPSVSLWNTRIMAVDERACDEPALPVLPSVGSPHIVCFSPYAMWRLHSTWEFTILRGLAMRGAKISLILCDGISPSCDLFWQEKTLPWDKCVVCQARTTQQARSLRMPFQWISHYIDRADKARIKDWVASLKDDEVRHAKREGQPVGDWVLGSVHSHFRLSRLELNPQQLRIYRNYLEGAALTFTGMRSAIEELQPETLWLSNGRMSLPRAAMEAARLKHVRTVCHERGVVRDSISLWENERCSQYVQRREAARRSNEIPLTKSQLRTACEWVKHRRIGKNLNWHPFMKQQRNSAATLAQMDIKTRDQFALVLTSSDDEFVAEPDRNRFFAEQYLWLRAILDWCRVHPSEKLVIRFHPNTSPESWKFLQNQLPELREEAHTHQVESEPNFKVIPPTSSLDTYAFMDAATTVLTYGTTGGVEAAALGKTVILADDCWYYGLPFVQSATSPSHFLTLLDAVSKTKVARDPHVSQRAIRFIWDYCLSQNIHSRLIRQQSLHEAVPRYRTDEPSSLAHGKDPGLDRITDIILGKRPVYDIRPPVDATVSTEETRQLEKFLRQFVRPLHQ